MANETGDQQLAHAIENMGEDDKGKEKGISGNNQNLEEERKTHNEDNAEQAADVNTNNGNACSVGESNLMTECIDPQNENAEQTSDVNTSIENTLNVGDDNVLVEGIAPEGGVAPETSDKVILDAIDEPMLDAIDEPPDGFFDDLLKDDFLDSLAVVDTWNPDAEDSCGSVADDEKILQGGREADNSNTQSALENMKRKDTEEAVSKNSESRSKRDSSGHRRKGDYSSQSGSRRYDKASAETKLKSSDRHAERRLSRKDKDVDERLRIVEKEMLRRYKSGRQRSRERRDEREKVSRDSKQRNSTRRERGSRDSTEKSSCRRDKNSREKSIEKNTHTHTRSRENRDKNIATDISRSERDKSTEGLVQKEDKCKDTGRVSHRYSYQYRVNNRDRTADGSAKERNSDLQHGVSNVSVDRKGSNESLRKEKSSDIDTANREIRTKSAYKERNLEKEISQGSSDMVKCVGEKRITKEAAGNLSHVLTNPSNPQLNSTKLDTCIKELDDLVPPGTEEDFIFFTIDEVVETAELKVKDNKKVERKHKCESVSNELLFKDKINPNKEAERVNYQHERKRRRSGSVRSEERKLVSSESKSKHDHVYEERKRRRVKSSSEEKKRNSSSLERMFEESRMKNELFNEKFRKGREYCSRSQSREKREHHSDSHRLGRRRDEQNDARQSRSGCRDKKRELSLGRERMGRSRSRDREYRKIHSDIRRSQSLSRDKEYELSQGRDRMGRSRSRERQYRNTSSEDRWQSDIGAQRVKTKKDVRDDSRRFVRSVSMDKQHQSSPPVRISKSRSRDRQLRTASSKYRDRQGRCRTSVSQEKEQRRRSLSKSRRSRSWYRRRGFNVSPVSVGYMSSPSLSFELSPISSERERWRSLSRSVSRERRSRDYRRTVRGSSFSPVSSQSSFSRSGSFVSLSSLSDERRQPRRKRSPFWKEIERKFAKDFSKTIYNQSAAYPFPSSAGTAPLEFYDPSSHLPAVHYPADPTLYSHAYPPEPGFSGTATQLPPDNIVPPSFGSAPPHHLEPPPPGTPVVAPTPALAPVYNVLPPGVPPFPVGFTGQPAPFSFSSEIPSPENALNRALHSSEKPQDPPEVPPPPKISQSRDRKKVSLSSLLEASAKVGGSAKSKRMSVDPVLVLRCEEAVCRLQVDDGVIMVSSGHFALQGSPRPRSQTATVTGTLLEDFRKFRSPILRTPEPQLSFTSVPVHDDSAEQLYCLPKDVAKYVEGQSQIHDAPCGHSAVASPDAVGSTKNLKSYVNISTMTDIYGDVKKVSHKPEKCLACLKRSKVMVWNSTQTLPCLESGDKIMVWNSTQTPRTSVESVRIQAEIVKLRPLRRWAARKKVSRKVLAVKEGNDVKSGSVKEAVNRRSSASRYNASKTSDSRSDTTPTAALKGDRSKEVSSESKQQLPKSGGSSASSTNKGGHSGDGTYYKTSTYQAYVSNHGKSSFSLYSSGSSDKESASSSAAFQRTVPPKGILKNAPVLPPSPSPQAPWQQSSFQKVSDVSGYSVTSKPFAVPGSMREYGNSSDLFDVRSSSSYGGMGSSGGMQPSASSTASVMFGNPGSRSTLDRDQNFYDFHHSQSSSLLQGSGNSGSGFRMPPFQQQSSMAFRQTGSPSMRPYDAGSRF